MTGMLVDWIAITFLIVGIISVYASRSQNSQDLHDISLMENLGVGIGCLIALILMSFFPTFLNVMKHGLRSSHYVPPGRRHD